MCIHTYTYQEYISASKNIGSLNSFGYLFSLYIAFPNKFTTRNMSWLINAVIYNKRREHLICLSF